MKLNKKLTNRQFILSHLLILSLGLIFLAGLYYILNTPQNNSSNTARGPVTALPKSLRIDLDQPDDNLLTFQASVIVSGNTLPLVQVLITTGSQDLVIESKKDGSFSTVIRLEEGANNLTVVVFDSSGETKQLERTIYYSKEKISLINLIIQTVYAADSTLEELKRDIASKAAKLKEAVSQKLTNKAYVGTIENKQSFSANKTADSLTLVTKTGAKIVTINQDTVFESKVKKQTRSNKTLSLKDYVATLGDIDDTGVLTAKKIILLPPPAIEPKTYLWGEIVSVSDNFVTLTDKNLKTHTVSLKKDLKLKLKDIVILTGNLNKNEIFEAGFVFVNP